MQSIKDILKPSFVRNEMDCFHMNNELNRPIMAVGYPRTIQEGWLDRIVSSEGSFDMSLHINPSPIDSALTRLNRELVKQDADLLAAQMKGIVNPSLKIQHEDTLKVLERLQKGEEKLFSISLYLNARAAGKEKLELLTRKIFSELNSIMIIPKIPFMRMHDAIKSVLPLQDDRLRMARDLTSDALSACFPFTTAFFSPESEGIMLGFNRTSGVPVVLEPYGLPNHNGLILGTSGGGKSVTAKLFIMRNLMRGIRTIIIDPQGEYVALTEKNGGKVIELGVIGRKPGAQAMAINPLDLRGKTIDERLPAVVEFLKILLGGISHEQEIFLLNSLPEIYGEKKGKAQNKKIGDEIHDAPLDAGIRPDARHSPKLADIYRHVISCKKGAKAGGRGIYESLEAKLRPFAKGNYSFLNRDTMLDMGSCLTCFDISQATDQLKPALIFLIMDFVHMSMKKDRERKMLVIDEAWSLLGRGEGSEHLFSLIKTARKFGLSIVIITQEAEDLISTPAGRAILANTAWKFLARQEPAVIEDLAGKFRLNEEEKALLLTAAPGEGLLFSLNDHIPLRVVASPEEYRLVTTNPEEMKALGAKSAPLHKTEPRKSGEISPGEETRAGGKNGAQRMAILALAEQEVRNYTDSIFPEGGAGLVDIAFWIDTAGEEESGETYGVIVPEPEKMEKIKEIMKNPQTREIAGYTGIFIIANEAVEKDTNIRKPFVAVTMQEFREKIRELFG